MQKLLHWKSNKYYVFREYMFLALGIQHAVRMRYIFICGLPGSTIFFHIVSQTTRFSKEKNIESMCFDFLYKLYLKPF